jgi:hypothetical protein
VLLSKVRTVLFGHCKYLCMYLKPCRYHFSFKWVGRRGIKRKKSLALSHTHSLSLSLSRYVLLFLSPSFFLTLSVSFSLSFSLSFFLSLSLPIFLSTSPSTFLFFPSLSLSLSPLCFSLSLPPYLSLCDLFILFLKMSTQRLSLW